MTRTGRPKSPERMVRRTVRNRPDVDAVLVRMAGGKPSAVAKWLRSACEEKVMRDAPGFVVRDFIREANKGIERYKAMLPPFVTPEREKSEKE